MSEGMLRCMLREVVRALDRIQSRFCRKMNLKEESLVRKVHSRALHAAGGCRVELRSEYLR